MRRGTALRALLLLAGCQALDPTEGYREAARSLRFKLESVEPKLDLALPLDRSRLRLRIHLGVENPSPVRLAGKALGGVLSLQLGERVHPLGAVAFPAGLDLPPGATSKVVADLAFDYGDLKGAWGPLTESLQRHRPATWRLEGEARVEVMGLILTLPLRASRRSGDWPAEEGRP